MIALIRRCAGVLLTCALVFGVPRAHAADDLHPYVTLETSMGNIVLELDAEKAPLTVANYLRYVREGHFDGTVFYRVVPGFVIQGGSYDADGNPRQVHEAIPYEGNNGLKNLRGSVSMARDDDPHSARSEFFIVLADNSALDHQPDDTAYKTGYTVFGHVAQGMDVVFQIAMVPLGGVGPFAGQAPLTPVVIKKASVTAAPPPPAALAPAAASALTAAPPPAPTR